MTPLKRIAIVIIVPLLLAGSAIRFGWWLERVHAQVVGTVPVVSGCTTTSSVTVCTLTDPATQRHWLIVGSAQGSIAVVEDELR